MTDIVETVARAMAEAMAEANGEPENWQAWVIDAKAALAAIEAVGGGVMQTAGWSCAINAREGEWIKPRRLPLGCQVVSRQVDHDMTKRL